MGDLEGGPLFSGQSLQLRKTGLNLVRRLEFVDLGSDTHKLDPVFDEL